MEFKALHVNSLTDEVAENLEMLLGELSGIEEFTVTLETRELYIMFDEKLIRFQDLVEKMAQAGCPLRDIDAALLL